MEREKMIDEIENILFEYDGHEESVPWVHIKYAHKIIDAIIPEGAVLLTKEEAEEYQEYKRILAEAESPRNAAFYRLGQKRHDEIEKETAREILDDIFSDAYSIGGGLYELTPKDKKILYKKYGVEVEE